MRGHCKFYILISGLLVVNTLTFSDEAPKYTPVVSGYASWESGEVVKGYSSAAGVEVDRAWLQTGYMGLCASADVSDHLRILAGGEGQFIMSFRRSENGNNNTYTELRFPQTVFSIKHGEALYSAGSVENPLFQLEAGFFPYKYNADVKDLGEYLFRTYCYPASMVNEFDKPYADLLGLRLGLTVKAGPGLFHNDLLLTTSMQFWPFDDFSLSYLADYSIPRIFTLGAGVQFFDLFSVGVDNPQMGIDPTTPDPKTMNGKNYTFAGTKLMGRFSFDPKGFFPADNFFVGLLGKEDFKLYGEMAILGLKNYVDTITANNDGYDNILWRMPVMIGMNIPTFRILNVLGIELEYWDSPYANSITNVEYNMLPLPSSPQAHSFTKWSIYGRKALGSHVNIIGQIANDHLMPKTMVMVNQFADFTDVNLGNSDWWWTLKMRFDF
jgi:hypothetical protein